MAVKDCANDAQASLGKEHRDCDRKAALWNSRMRLTRRIDSTAHVHRAMLGRLISGRNPDGDNPNASAVTLACSLKRKRRLDWFKYNENTV